MLGLEFLLNMGTLGAVLALAAGFVVLFFGAEILVRGSNNLAIMAGIRPVVVGLTIVAFGTSAPELVVTLTSVMEDARGIGLGNIIGSNIANIGLILGIAAMIHPLRIEKSLLKIEIPILLTVTILFVLFAMDGVLARWEGIILLVGIVTFCLYAIKVAKLSEGEETEEVSGKKPLQILYIVFGILGLVIGGYYIVGGGVDLARAYKIPEFVIGVSLIAVGTSLPELATSIVAAARGKSDLCVGNVLGSNIFNILLVFGILLAVYPFEFTSDPDVAAASGGMIEHLEGSEMFFSLDFPVMCLFTLLLFPFMRSGFILNRLEGFFLLLLYGVYIYIRYVY